MAPTLHPNFLTFSNTQKYLLGISGGRDSVALLHLLLANGYEKLVLCHLNHGLRGEESDQDAQLVEKLAHDHSLPFEIERINLNQIMETSSESMELAARNARHRFFKQCAQKYDCQRLLLAHHVDDQAETILFNLLRGSGGLRGMSFETKHSDLYFYRPLLGIKREDINTYLTENKILYRDDSTNDQAIATRNRLRNEAIPLLENIMGRNIQSSLSRAEEVSSNNETALREILSTYELEDPQGRLFLPTIQDLHPALQRITLLDYLKKHHVSNINYSVLNQCLNLLSDSSTAKVNLPGDRYFRRKEKRLFIEKNS